MDSLLRKLEAAREGSLELDAEFKTVFPSAPSNVTRSIDAVVQLIEAELPGWWWTWDIAQPAMMHLSTPPALANTLIAAVRQLVPTARPDLKHAAYSTIRGGAKSSMKVSTSTCVGGPCHWRCSESSSKLRSN